MRLLCVCCLCAPKPRKMSPQKGKLQKMDFRRADPNYVNFVPRTCVDAIDLFNRHRNLGLTADLYPECFVHCARQLPGEELDKFHRFIVAPNGDIEKGGGTVTQIDKELENERRELEQEAINRDMECLTIAEEVGSASPPSPMSQDDEKTPMECTSCKQPTCQCDEEEKTPMECSEGPTQSTPSPSMALDLQDYMFIASDR